MKTKITMAIIAMASPMIASIWLLVNEGVNPGLATLIPIAVYLCAFIAGYQIERIIKRMFD